MISYQHLGDSDLKVAKCNDPACDLAVGGAETRTTVDETTDEVGSFTAIAVGTDGFPVISYFDDTNDDLKVVKCDDAACEPGGETITTVDGAGTAVGRQTSIAIGADGNPVVSYFSNTGSDLKVARCNDVACAGGNETITIVDGPINVGNTDTSIAIGVDDNPVISYHQDTQASISRWPRPTGAADRPHGGRLGGRLMRYACGEDTRAKGGEAAGAGRRGGSAAGSDRVGRRRAGGRASGARRAARGGRGAPPRRGARDAGPGGRADAGDRHPHRAARARP